MISREYGWLALDDGKLDSGHRIAFLSHDCEGETFEVLIEEESTTRSGEEFHGRTDGNKLVIFPAGPYRRGDMISVKITDATPHGLKSRGIPNR